MFALLIGGIAYANHVLTVKPKRERTKTTAEMLGLRADADVQGSLSAFPFALLERPQATTSEVMAGPWRGQEVRLFDLETIPSIEVEGAAHRDGSPASSRRSPSTRRTSSWSPRRS